MRFPWHYKNFPDHAVHKYAKFRFLSIFLTTCVFGGLAFTSYYHKKRDPDSKENILNLRPLSIMVEGPQKSEFDYYDNVYPSQ